MMPEVLHPAKGSVRGDTGRCGHHAGLAAEDGVAAEYGRRGHPVMARRWRGTGGELDLVMQDGDGVIVVEVKKSRSFSRALERLTTRQIGRLVRAAEEFLGTQPRGALTDIRFDVALVNARGEIRVIENALA